MGVHREVMILLMILRNLYSRFLERVQKIHIGLPLKYKLTSFDNAELAIFSQLFAVVSA
jgi:hypothetical protein